MKRKLIAFMTAALAMLLAFSTGASALTTNATNEIEITALSNLPEIDVVMPGGGDVYINPYKMSVEIDGESTTEQIVSTPASIENRSEVPLSVGVTVVATVNEGSDMVLCSDYVNDPESRSKKAFIYLEMQAVKDPDRVTWDSKFDDEKHLSVRTGLSRSRKEMLTIEQADKPNHYGALRLAGDCVPTPRNPWTEADGVEISIAFTFTPLGRDNS